MTELNLTRGLVTQLDAEDLEFLNQWKWSAHPGGSTFYAYRMVGSRSKQKAILLHRVLLGLQCATTGKNLQSDVIVDHKNGNGLDNRRSNLRPVTTQQNNLNRQVRKDSSSGVKGVCRRTENDRIRWVAYICKDHKMRYLGSFPTLEEARKVRLEAEQSLHGEYAHAPDA